MSVPQTAQKCSAWVRRTFAILTAALIAGCANIAPAPAPASSAAPPAADDTGRMAEQLARCQQAQREERRRSERLAQQLREERHKSEAMQRKIDSLRAIDREMMMERREP